MGLTVGYLGGAQSRIRLVLSAARLGRVLPDPLEATHVFGDIGDTHTLAGLSYRSVSSLASAPLSVHRGRNGSC